MKILFAIIFVKNYYSKQVSHQNFEKREHFSSEEYENHSLIASKVQNKVHNRFSGSERSSEIIQQKRNSRWFDFWEKWNDSIYTKAETELTLAKLSWKAFLCSCRAKHCWFCELHWRAWRPLIWITLLEERERRSRLYRRMGLKEEGNAVMDCI